MIGAGGGKASPQFHPKVGAAGVGEEEQGEGGEGGQGISWDRGVNRVHSTTAKIAKKISSLV